MGRHALLSVPFHKNSVTFLSNRLSARDGAGAAESTQSTVGRIMVYTMSARLWMDRFLLLHAFSRVNALASAFSHDATLGLHEMMAPRYRVLSFGPTIVPGMTSGGGGSCVMKPHRNDVVFCKFIPSLFREKCNFRCGVVGNISVSHMLASGSIPGIGIIFSILSFIFCESSPLLFSFLKVFLLCFHGEPFVD